MLAVRSRQTKSYTNVGKRFVRIVPAMKLRDGLRIHLPRRRVHQRALLEIRFENSFQRYEECRAVVAMPIRITERRNFGIVNLHLRLRIARQGSVQGVEQNIAMQLMPRPGVAVQAQLQFLVIARGIDGFIHTVYIKLMFYFRTILLLVASFSCFGQGYLSPLEVNKKVVFDFYRLVFEPRNADLVDQFVAPDFVDHNPLVSNGVDGIVKFLKALPASESYDVGDKLRNPPALIAAEGDIVTYMFRRLVPDPATPGKTMDKFSFDVFRIKNKKMVEHWD